MSSRIAIARPAVNLKALRRYRVSVPHTIVAEVHRNHACESDSTSPGYEQQMIKIISSCWSSRSPVFISRVVLISSVLFPAVWLGKALMSVSSLHRRLPYPFLSMTALGIFFCVNFIAFPIITLSTSVLLGFTMKYARRLSMEVCRLGHAVNDRLCHIDVYVANHCALLQMVLESQASSLLDRLEEKARNHGVNFNAPQLEQSNTPPSNAVQEVLNKEIPLETRGKSNLDMELGQLPPNPAFQTNRNRLIILQDNPVTTFMPTIRKRDAKVQLLKALQPNLETEPRQLSTIPSFDAEGWLLVSNPELGTRLDEQLKRGKSFGISPSGGKRCEATSL